MTREDTTLREEAAGSSRVEAGAGLTARSRGAGSSPEAEAASEIAAAIIAGDRSAEARLIDRYARGVRRVLRRNLNISADVDDLLQDVWVTAFPKVRRRELKDPAKLRSFLCGIARGLASNHRNKFIRQATMADGDRMEARRASTDGPAESLDRLQSAQLVRQVLDELPIPRDRELLTRFFLRGDDKTTVCAALELTAAQFNSVLFRAKQRFKILLEQARADQAQQSRENRP